MGGGGVSVTLAVIQHENMFSSLSQVNRATITIQEIPDLMSSGFRRPPNSRHVCRRVRRCFFTQCGPRGRRTRQVESTHSMCCVNIDHLDTRSAALVPCIQDRVQEGFSLAQGELCLTVLGAIYDVFHHPTTEIMTVSLPGAAIEPQETSHQGLNSCGLLYRS